MKGTLVVSSRALPRVGELAGEAGRRGYGVVWEVPRGGVAGKGLFYGGTDMAVAAGRGMGVVMLEPGWDLLARLPREWVLREVRFGRYGELGRVGGEWFVKPADSLAKVFDAGVYRDVGAMGHRRAVAGETAVLMSEPVEWMAEYRVWVVDGKVVTTSAYMSMGRPVHHQAGSKGLAEGSGARGFVERMLGAREVRWPPTFVVDVGLIEERGWAVVEFNPVWCSGLLGGEVGGVLTAVERACVRKGAVREEREWVVREWD